MSNLTELEKRAIRVRTEKFNMDSLQTEPAGKPRFSVEDRTPTKPSIHEISRISELKEKFGISRLHMEDSLENKLAMNEMSLEEASRLDSVDKAQRMKLCVGSVKVGQSAPTRIWYEISR